MKVAVRERLKVAYAIFAIAFLILCLGSTVAVLLIANTPMSAIPLALQTSISAWMIRSSVAWLLSGRRFADWLNLNG